MISITHPLNRHIGEVKRRLIIIGVTILVAFIIAFTFSAGLIEWFKRPFADDLIFYGPAEALFASIKISFLAGIIVSFPVIIHQFWCFIRPALLHREQRWAIPLFLLALGFFILGLIFCNLVILPLVINFFVTFGLERDLTPELAVGTYVDFNVRFLIAFGFAFELPLVMTLLTRAGMIQSQKFIRFRRHAALLALIISAVITPDATLFTLMLMAVPLIVLYEIGILGTKVFGIPKKPKKEDEEKVDDPQVSNETAKED